LEENIQKLKSIANKQVIVLFLINLTLQNLQNTCVAPQKVDEDSSSSDDNGEEDSEDEN
jgi:hypothetical protein